jgi:hypothetical protein
MSCQASSITFCRYRFSVEAEEILILRQILIKDDESCSMRHVESWINIETQASQSI